jgi:AbrB family looped-hinge helix DNA binding protein
MVVVKVTRNSQVTLPKEIREKLGINEGDIVEIRTELGKIVIEKIEEDIWDNCSDFLPENFEKILQEMRSDATKRFKRMGILP